MLHLGGWGRNEEVLTFVGVEKLGKIGPHKINFVFPSTFFPFFISHNSIMKRHTQTFYTPKHSLTTGGVPFRTYKSIQASVLRSPASTPFCTIVVSYSLMIRKLGWTLHFFFHAVNDTWAKPNNWMAKNSDPLWKQASGPAFECVPLVLCLVWMHTIIKKHYKQKQVFL